MSLLGKIRQEKTIQNRWQRSFYARRASIDLSLEAWSFQFGKEVKELLTFSHCFNSRSWEISVIPSKGWSQEEAVAPAAVTSCWPFWMDRGGFIVMGLSQERKVTCQQNPVTCGDSYWR